MITQNQINHHRRTSSCCGSLSSLLLLLCLFRLFIFFLFFSQRIHSIALKFTLQGKINCCMYTYFKSERIIFLFLFCVTDTGPGLSTQQQKEMFQVGAQFNANDLQAGGGRFWDGRL